MHSPSHPLAGISGLEEIVAADTKETLEEQVEILLLGMNRHGRRAWCARMMRKAGKQRKTVLQAKMPKEKADRRAARDGTT